VDKKFIFRYLLRRSLPDPRWPGTGENQPFGDLNNTNSGKKHGGLRVLFMCWGEFKEGALGFRGGAGGKEGPGADTTKDQIWLVDPINEKTTKHPHWVLANQPWCLGFVWVWDGGRGPAPGARHFATTRWATNHPGTRKKRFSKSGRVRAAGGERRENGGGQRFHGPLAMMPYTGLLASCGLAVIHFQQIPKRSRGADETHVGI